MFIGDKIFYYCGPPLYDAAKLMNVDPEEDASLWGQLEPQYLEKYDEDRKGKLTYCKYCWANGNFAREYEEHCQAS